MVAGASFVLGGALALVYELIDEAGRQAGRHTVIAVGMLGGVALACGSSWGRAVCVARSPQPATRCRTRTTGSRR
ncbi:hypothetical protein KV102_06230 [Mumia sp. zg.B53]|uniref:hypothetical protein n=1 Tax=Mumia sp. zg.B53 TaxID=2855449 RepID=UPI001C6E8F0D|nr:hypothetical protein [Mumia sp. zg.B53]MBW9214438.1 hypothetical protein [Mumia sp. zg.B53]